MSEHVILEGKNTPRVVLNSSTGECSISGRSFPENSKKFYTEVYEWVEQLVANGHTDFIFSCRFIYLSSSSIISLLEILKIVNDSQRFNSKMIWFYEEDDEDVRKIGEDYEKVLHMPVELISEE